MAIRIVLTGGPGGGKTTLMRELRADDPSAKRWILVPEAAPLLFQAGLNGHEPAFQRAVVRLQIALEEICAESATSDQVLLCHRGTLDPLAYWLRNGWNENTFFDFIDMTREEHFHRYYGVVHLQTAAIGADAFYIRWPHAHRPETIEQAAQTDLLCTYAWQEHPNYAFVDNNKRDWDAKSQIAHHTLTNWLKNKRR
ncbi:AAA family ATPase [Aggregatilinea lenta]|uniref:AAA family ATPase n=1 Tax=Aggregatilinea lenta TaxID=913108 RepID=UPI000E5C1877|nr:AAA family ATPase [Aggregatilinea lenta]